MQEEEKKTLNTKYMSKYNQPPTEEWRTTNRVLFVHRKKLYMDACYNREKLSNIILSGS